MNGVDLIQRALTGLMSRDSTRTPRAAPWAIAARPCGAVQGHHSRRAPRRSMIGSRL